MRVEIEAGFSQEVQTSLGAQWHRAGVKVELDLEHPDQVPVEWTRLQEMLKTAVEAQITVAPRPQAVSGSYSQGVPSARPKWQVSEKQEETIYDVAANRKGMSREQVDARVSQLFQGKNRVGELNKKQASQVLDRLGVKRKG